MSHKFSFLQAFAGYYSWQRELLSTYRKKYWLKSLPAGLRVEYNRQVSKMRLLANMGKSGTQICGVAGISQIASDLGLLVDADGAYKYFRLVAVTFFNVTSEYVCQYNIQHLKKNFFLSWLRWGFFQCEYLLQYIERVSIDNFSLRKEYCFVTDFSNNYRNICLPFRFSKNCN